MTKGINVSTSLVRQLTENGVGKRNLLKSYVTSAKRNKLHTAQWYREMHDICAEIADFYKLPLNLVVGIMAVVSPQQNVTSNVNACVKAIGAYRNGAHCENTSIGGYPANKRKAFAMMESGEVFPHLSGDKVVPFYQNIMHYNSPEYVTIDRHAIHLFLYGYNGKCSGALRIDSVSYNLIASVYNDVAAMLGYLPSEFQALTWTIQASANQYI